MKLKIELELEYTTHWADDVKVEVADIPALGLKTQAKPENIERAAISAAQMWLQICLDRGTILAWKNAGLGAAVSASPQPSVDIKQKCINFICQNPYPAWDQLVELVESCFAAAPAQEPRIGEPCPTCERTYLGKMGPGDYSCCVCGMGMVEPCEHWKSFDENAAQEQPVEDSPQLDDSRCAICGWPLAESVEKGCTRGNCSMRPFPDNIYDPARANKEYKTERFTNSPQKGKP